MSAITVKIRPVRKKENGRLKNGEKVSLVGFGAFEAKDRPARKGHNPMTGEVISINASKAPSFKAGKSLKEILN